MSKEEIKEMIDSTLVGQGNQMDLSDKLPVILNAILDLIEE